MKIWTKIKVKEQNKDINIIANSLANYIYLKNPIKEMYYKYNIEKEDKEILESYTVNRIAGLLLLYFSKDTKRINDIVNKYNYNNKKEVFPELEGYIDKS